MLIRQRVNRRYVLSRDQEDMRWRSRKNVTEPDNEVILIDDRSGNVSGSDSTEDTLVIGRHPSSFRQWERLPDTIMPELPEVETVCRTLDPLLRGKVVERVDLFWHRTLDGVSPSLVEEAIHASPIVNVTRRAKLILIHFQNGYALSVHLRMTGELLYLESRAYQRAEKEQYLRMSITFVDGTMLAFYDPRKFGRIRLLDRVSLERLSQTYGVEPLGTEFTIDHFSSLLKSRSRQMKPLLLDQTLVVGLGNIYVDECLFLAGVHPLSRSDLVPAPVVARLHAAIVEVLQSAIDHDGTTLATYRTGRGEEGRNQFRLRMYGLRAGTPCTNCGTPVERLVVGQRGTTFCPTCQHRFERQLA